MAILDPNDPIIKSAMKSRKLMAASAPAFGIPKYQPLNLVNPVVESVKENQASEFHRRLAKWVKEFDATLDDTCEVGIRLVSFGQTVIFHLQNIGFWNPSLISFAGVTDAGEPVELIQHVTQISLLLMKLPRKDPEKPKQAIGFSAPPEPVDEVEAAEADEPTQP
jgi:hypothetical protein